MSIVEVRSLSGCRVNKPRVYVMGYVGGVVPGASYNPGYGIIIYGISHCCEGTCIVDEQAIWVELTVPIDVVAFDIH